MILEIRLSNFFSINDEIVLDLRAGNIQTKRTKELDSNTFDFKNEKVLKTIAIYGANASGKSNIINAVKFCNRMIFNSHLHNENTIFNFKPFKFEAGTGRLSTFFIRFILNEIEYEYSFSLNQKEIIKESLYYYPKGRKAKIFERNELSGTEKNEKYSFSNVIKRPLDVAQNTSSKTLYISRASQMDREIGKEIFNYFYSHFMSDYYRINDLYLEKQLTENKDFLLKALQVADSDIIDIKLIKEKKKQLTFGFKLSPEETVIKEEKEFDSLTILTYHKFAPTTPFDFQTEESEGTKKLFFILLSIIDIVKNNKILIIDEIETHLHTKIVEFIISLFHQGNKAQLIFSTHNTNLLDLNKFRKDQIYFSNKNSKGATELYSLFDYKDFRENMDLEKGYLQGRFDAIPFIDDSINIKNLIDEQ